MRMTPTTRTARTTRTSHNNPYPGPQRCGPFLLRKEVFAYLSQRKNALDETFILVKVKGIPMLFTTSRIDKNTIPPGMVMYQARHGDGSWTKPAEISLWVVVNYVGTLISFEKLSLTPDPYRGNDYLLLKKGDWQRNGKKLTLKEYMAMYSPQKAIPDTTKRQSRER